MDFRLSDEQRLVRESARSLLERECPPAHVKEVERRPPFYDVSLWRRAADLGWIELAADPAATLDCALLLEELGRAAAPIPLLDTALAARALRRSGVATVRDRWLDPLVRGEAIASVAITELAGRVDAAGTATTAQRSGDHVTLHGEKAYVAYGTVADLLLVATHFDDRRTEDSLGLVAVAADSEGIERRPMDAGPGVPVAEVVLEGVRVGETDVVAPPGQGIAAIREIVVDASVLTSALMLGHAAQACDQSVAYAKVREQFGVPIGSFQAVQHRLADMAMDVETLRALVAAAAWKLAHGEPDAELAARIAKAWGAEVLERVVAGAHQVHAGIGYTDNHDIQLHTRRAPWYAAMFGDPRYHYATAASLLGL